MEASRQQIMRNRVFLLVAIFILLLVIAWGELGNSI